MVQLNLRHKNSNSKKFCVVVDVKTEWIFPSAGGEMKSEEREECCLYVLCSTPKDTYPESLGIIDAEVQISSNLPPILGEHKAHILHNITTHDGEFVLDRQP